MIAHLNILTEMLIMLQALQSTVHQIRPLSHEVLSLSNALFACRWFASVAPDNTTQLDMVVKGIQSVFTENQNRAR